MHSNGKIEIDLNFKADKIEENVIHKKAYDIIKESSLLSLDNMRQIVVEDNYIKECIKVVDKVLREIYYKIYE
ncbi:hypothetical protein EC501_15695 [Lysinibacillus halotolerans]|uniref:Uncharacterized protein n=1 Tax=Lysinibacillus halotolerans TaxID=1368476 RepID=A0A3M8H552_9BACI|nr:hypothetical protein EC501_15695 [Lysinibacillus halotolerans]